MNIKPPTPYPPPPLPQRLRRSQETGFSEMFAYLSKVMPDKLIHKASVDQGQKIVQEEG